MRCNSSQASESLADRIINSVSSSLSSDFPVLQYGTTLGLVDTSKYFAVRPSLVQVVGVCQYLPVCVYSCDVNEQMEANG